MDYGEFKCKWIDPVSLCNIADKTWNKYWPESKLPVNTEEIVEFRLRLNIEPVKHLFWGCCSFSIEDRAGGRPSLVHFMKWVSYENGT